MPIYTVKDEQTGKTFDVEGDSPPTEQELEQIFAVVSQPQQSAQEAKSVRDGLTELAQLPGKALKKMREQAESLRSRGWENLNPTERLELMALAFPAKAAPALSSVAEAGAEAAPGMAMRAIPVVAGQALGGASRIPGASRAGAALGGVVGEVAGSLYEGEPVTAGRLGSAAITAAATGRPLVNAPAARVVDEAGRQAAANILATNVQSLVDEGEFAALEQDANAALFSALGVGGSKLADTGARAKKARVRAATDAPALATIKESAEAGYKVNPSLAMPTEFDRATIALVRKDLGLGPTAQLREDVVSRRIKTLNKVYDEAGKISADAKVAMEAMKAARAESRRLWKAYNASNGTKPELADTARALDIEADGFEQLLINEADAKGLRKVAEKLIQTRPQLAKAYLADRAMDYARGVPNAKVYADEFNRGARITGPAATIAKSYMARQNRREAVGSLLSRAVTLAKIGSQLAEESAPGQMLARRAPAYTQYPDATAEVIRVMAARQGREEPGYDMNAVTRYMMNPAPMIGGGR